MWGLDVRIDGAGEYRWQLWSADGRRSAMAPAGFRARYNAHKAANLFRDHSRDLEYVLEQVGPAEYRWMAIGGDGVPVAVSPQPFATAEAAELAADTVRKHATLAQLS